MIYTCICICINMYIYMYIYIHSSSPDGIVLAHVGVEPLLELLVYPLQPEMV